MKVVILAGGKGTRLWPLSQESCPKPFLRLGSSYSFLQRTVLRFLESYGAKSIVVLTSRACEDLVREQCLELDRHKEIAVVVENCSRGTAPAFALALSFLQDRGDLGEDEPVLLTPSDGILSPLEGFHETLFLAQKQAKKGALVVFGVKPSRPETGYGYIQIGKKQDSLFSCKRFIEKPSYFKAKKLMQKEDVLWNTGHLLVTANTFWKQAKQHCPEIGRLQEFSYQELEQEFALLPDVSIDIAILEKSLDVLVGKMAIDWSDIGSWDSIYNAFKKDENGNVKMGSVFAKNAKNCLLIGSHRPVVAIGLQDLLIVETQEGVFIGKKGQAQEMKKQITLMQQELSLI